MNQSAHSILIKSLYQEGREGSGRKQALGVPCVYGVALFKEPFKRIAAGMDI